MQLIRKLTAKFLQLLIDLEKYRLHAFLFIYFSGVCVYYFLFDVYWLSAFYHAAALFVVDAKINLQSDYYLKSALLYIVGFFAAVYTILFFLSLLARRLRNNLNIKIRCNEPYILVCGLGEKAQAYIDSELAVKVKNILVVEKDKDNLAIEEYRDKGVAVKLADASDIEVLKKNYCKIVIRLKIYFSVNHKQSRCVIKSRKPINIKKKIINTNTTKINKQKSM